MLMLVKCPAINIAAFRRSQRKFAIEMFGGGNTHKQNKIKYNGKPTNSFEQSGSIRLAQSKSNCFQTKSKCSIFEIIEMTFLT